MVAIQHRLLSLIALCTLVSSSTIQRAQRADNLDNGGISQNTQNSSLTTPGKDVEPPAEFRLGVHQPNSNGDNHNSQAYYLDDGIHRRSVESSHKIHDDDKPNSDAGSGESLLAGLLGSGEPPTEKMAGVVARNAIQPDEIQDETTDDMAIVESKKSDQSSHRMVRTKRLDIEGEPIVEVGGNKTDNRN